MESSIDVGKKFSQITDEKDKDGKYIYEDTGHEHHRSYLRSMFKGDYEEAKESENKD